MSRHIRSSVVAVLLAVTFAGGRARAQEAGQEDLDRATEAKLSAETVNDLGEVIRLLESALEKGLDKENTQFAHGMLASALIQRGSVLANMIRLNSTRDPNFAEHPKVAPQRKAALADLEKGAKLSPPQPQALYFIGWLNQFSDGDARRAIEALSQAIDLSAEQPPLRAQSLILRASIEKDPKKQMADLDEAIRTVPDDPLAVRTRGLLRADLGKLEESLADLDKAIELAPKSRDGHQAKAIVLTRMKKYDEALVSLDKVSELSPNSVLPLLQKARIHVLQSNLDAALFELTQAHQMAPESVDVLSARAQVYRDQGQEEKALADYGQAVEVYSAVLAQRPDYPLALRGRGDALLNSGRQQQAIADYEALLKLQPKEPGTLNNLAWVLATSPDEKLRDGKRAVALATEACELTQYKAAHILSTLGAAYAETGDFQTAIKWVEKGLESAGEDEKEPLGKELESYRAGKPFRELFSAGKSREEEPQQ